VLWLATDRGLLKYEPGADRMAYQGQSFDPNQISRSTIHVFRSDRAGVLWAGTNRGLYSYDRELGKWALVRYDPGNPETVVTEQILAICVDESGLLWLGTNAGLARFDRANGSLVHYGTEQGLADQTVLGVLEDDQGYVWVNTLKGISRFDPRNAAFRNYGPREGAEAGELQLGCYLKSHDGELFFGGINGVIAFFPDQIRDNPQVPPVALTSLTVNGLPVSKASPDSLTAITLRWPRNSFEFEFAGLSYARPESNQYAYKLEGFDAEWNQSGTRRYGTYTNLPGGTYTLHMKASNNDGLWNEQGAAVKVTVIPPFWQTWWFLAGVAVVVLGGTGGGYWWRVSRLAARGRELEGLVAQRTAELQKESAERSAAEEALRRNEMEQAVSAERSRLARDLHDSVTQSLYSVNLYAEAAVRLLQTGDSTTAASHLRELRDTAQEALAEMRLLVFELRPPALEREGLVAALQARLMAVERRAGLETQFAADLVGRLPPAVEEGLYRIAQEALNNALKHAHAHLITVSVTQQERMVVLRIGDDGAGFDPAAARERGGLGLKAMQERAAKLGGRVVVNSEPGKGTQIVVEVIL